MARVSAHAVRKDRGDAMNFAMLAQQAAAIQVACSDIPDPHQAVRFFRVLDLTLPRNSLSSPSLPIASSGCAARLEEIEELTARVRA